MKFNKEEIEKKKESVEIQGVHIKAAIEEKENTLSSVTKQLEEHKEMNEEISDFRKFETKTSSDEKRNTKTKSESGTIKSTYLCKRTIDKIYGQEDGRV